MTKSDDPRSGYASVNGLKMYYEMHGTGRPLVLLHGALSAIGTSFGKILSSLAKTRQVIAVEQQAHGHTADIDRPLYARIAPNPDDWPMLIAKNKQLDLHIPDLPTEAIQSIKAPTLLIIGDSDIIRPEHIVEMYRLLGGGVPIDASGLSKSQLAVLPGTTHVTLVDRAEWLVSMVTAFLDAPMPASK